jgi:demethoxyubiquinone hydroxylase (CLK1/Coq7/Cat5 family)
MRAEEIEHGAAAAAAGGVRPPALVCALMRRTARIMTGSAYWI